jgi:hypothetical protein
MLIDQVELFVVGIRRGAQEHELSALFLLSFLFVELLILVAKLKV